MIWLGLLVALLLSGLFSGLEIAYVSASKLRVELKKQQGGRRARLIRDFYTDPARFLGSLLVGNNISLVVFTLLLTSLLAPVLEHWISGDLVVLLIITLVGTLVVLVFGEFLPKVIFRNYGEEALYNLAIPVRLLTIVLAAPSWFFTRLSKFLLRMFTKNLTAESDNSFSRLELESLVRDTQSFSETRIDTDLFGKALHLRQVKVRDCMVPRTEIECIDVNDSLEELTHLFIETKLSRILVIDGDIDNVLGYVHHQKMLSAKGPIRKMIFQLPIVPETMKVQDLLNTFIVQKSNIACVVDEYGGTSGIITMEDILEQIFGEIEDEHDEEEFIEVQVGDQEYLFSGRLEIDYLNEKYPELHLPKGEYSTLSGYLTMVLERIPEEGEALVDQSNKYVFELVSDKKIETVRVYCQGLSDETTSH
jgi:putative hemolysin